MPSLLQRPASHREKKNKKSNTTHSPDDTNVAASRSEWSVTDPMVNRLRSESGMGRSGSQSSSTASLRSSHEVRSNKPIPDLPPVTNMSSLDIRGGVSDASDVGDVSDGSEEVILWTPRVNTPKYPSISLQKSATLPGVRSYTPIALTTEDQTLPTLGATPTPSPPHPNSKPPAPAENRLSGGSDLFANGGGSKADNNGFGGFGTETETKAELGAEGETTADGAVTEVKEEKEDKSARKVVVDDFEMMRVIGKGRAGKVLLVRHRSSTELYALKVITKRQVLAQQELQHTLTEQAVLKRMAREGRDPFVVKLWWSFHDKENLFLVMDFHPGGDLAAQLARWGRLSWDRARFYAAEIVEGCEGLHAAGIIYRDLKPENILIDADGHIVLTDFGLSKEFPHKVTNLSPTVPPTPNDQTGFITPHWMDAAGSPGRASTNKRLDRDMTITFCGTPEYLAPEIIRSLPYSYEVDWWSFGIMLYKMLTGITPFWANNQSDMYIRVLQDELQFPDDEAMDQDTKSLIRGLLQRNPALRMCEPRVKKHPYFSMIDWQHIYYRRYIPPYIPPIDPSNAGDTQNFDRAFLDMEPVIADETDHTDSEREDSDSESARAASGGGKSPERPAQEGEETVDVFDGYSFKGRDSIIIDDDGSDESDEPKVSNIRDAEMSELDTRAGPVTTDEKTASHITPTNFPEVERESAPHINPLNAGDIPDFVEVFESDLQVVRPGIMTQLEICEYLIKHGCPDLRLLVDARGFSSCRAAEGAFGDVYKGRLTDGTSIAVKVLRYALASGGESKNIKRVTREIYNWSKLDHINVHKLLGVTMFEGRLGMVSRWMENGSLQHYLNLPQCNNINRYALCPQVAKGVAYLHGMNMIHGDLKACNILVSTDGILKLTDFDYSIVSGLSLGFSATTRLGGGTLRWMAPELVLAKDEDPTERNKQTDVYALGMTFLASALVIPIQRI